MPHTLTVRWSCHADHPAMLALEHEVFGDNALLPVSLEALCQDTYIVPLVATLPVPGNKYAECVVGECFYELQRERIHIHRIGVLPIARRMGVGTAMLCKALLRLRGRRREATVFVNADDEQARVFFEVNGWRTKRTYSPLDPEMDGGGMLELAYGYCLGAEIIERIWNGNARVLRCEPV
jgi:ribosomal protein S18 acetylase RimI-like enzyme